MLAFAHPCSILHGLAVATVSACHNAMVTCEHVHKGRINHALCLALACCLTYSEFLQFLKKSRMFGGALFAERGDKRM
jgi:hypothetical protein